MTRLRSIARGLLLISLGLVIALFTAWSALLLHYSVPTVPGALLAAAMFGCGAAALASLAVPRWRLPAGACFLVAAFAVLTWWSSIEPSNDREWKAETAVLPYATIEGDLVTVHNIRNFDYRTETDFTPAYYDKTYDLRELQGVDVVATYWMGPDIAHIFLSFQFGDDHLAISIERRDEQGEGYSTVRGLFRQYELFYVVADERDVIRVRTNFRKDPEEHVYLYRVKGQPENFRRLFLDYIREINSLKDKPEFYNTMLTNCTTNIWMHAGVNAGRAPFSWKILASGHVPEYLYEQGRLDATLPFTELQQKSLVNERAHSAGPDDFSLRIRDGLPGMTARK